MHLAVFYFSGLLQCFSLLETLFNIKLLATCKSLKGAHGYLKPYSAGLCDGFCFKAKCK